MYSNDRGEPNLPGVDPALEHTLDRLQPRPEPTFAQSLEASLLKRIEAAQTDRGVARQRWSWTLAATVVTTMLLAALLVIARPATFGPIFSAAPIQATTLTMVPPTPTHIPAANVIMPLNLQPLVITRTNLGSGTALTDEMLAEMTIIWIDVAYVPEGAITDMAAMAGKAVLRPVRAWEPVLASNLVEQDVMGPIPTGMVGFIIPRARINADYLPLSQGQVVDVFDATQVVEVNGAYQAFPTTPYETIAALEELEFIRIRLAHRALIVGIWEVVEAGSRVVYVQLAVTPEEATALQWADESLPLSIIQVQ